MTTAVLPYFRPARPRVLAHRGLAGPGVPENTLSSFRRALAAGAEYVETDAHCTRDGHAVLFHDPSLRRVTGDPRPIADLELAELQRIDLGGDRIPTLSEALAEFPGARFNLDIKAAAAAAPAAAAIIGAGAADRVLVTSFDEGRRSAIVRAVGREAGADSVASSASARILLRVLPAAALGLRGALRRSLAGVQALQVPERFRGVPVVTKRLLAQMHALGVEVHVWTVNDPTDMRRLLDLGVDGIVTDRCDLALELVRSR
ncbi:glycerophosphoryl diester phosphodiesterase [Plantibacter sp. VKM Ac-1784]|uniref:Glycerophosphoryl diester phosphodiesterase n=1 Tax=Plantibacter elymi (nom. nud.) TaxID=199708 RepID=A0ABY1RAW4_9MICO|nr:glycerophosphodiester phosphodiesterase family protein [Plantibacter sp. VKM Ac-1784]SMQ66656.1 glycerophosphoryl diester phosphodiesterase [Plantibacter sp. VKM Ac-1784]